MKEISPVLVVAVKQNFLWKQLRWYQHECSTVVNHYNCSRNLHPSPWLLIKHSMVSVKHGTIFVCVLLYLPCIESFFVARRMNIILHKVIPGLVTQWYCKWIFEDQNSPIIVCLGVNCWYRLLLCIYHSEKHVHHCSVWVLRQNLSWRLYCGWHSQRVCSIHRPKPWYYWVNPSGWCLSSA